MLNDIFPLHAPSLGGLSLLLVATAIWLRYTTVRGSFLAREKSGDGKGVPPTFPHVLPLLGTLPIAYMWKPRDFVLDQKSFFQTAHPVLVKILGYEFFVIQGVENVRALFRGSWASTSIPFIKHVLHHVFGMPAAAARIYELDDSGGGSVPRKGSTIEPRNRADYLTHQSMVQLLDGPGMMPFYRRFAVNIARQFRELHDRLPGTDWEPRDDLFEFVTNAATVAILNALCGPHLLRLNPDFLQDYWAFDRNFQTYFQGTPRFRAPRAYAIRDRCLRAVKVWHEHARAHYDDSARDADGDDPFWGSSTFRTRQAMFRDMDGFDEDAAAAEDLGAMWASRNSMASTFWTIFNVFRDADLLARVRAEADACVLPPSQPTDTDTDTEDGLMRFDAEKLLRQPFLQAAYAETLRLRMHFYIVRMPARTDMPVRDWIIPRQEIAVTSTTVAHMDPKAWGAGAGAAEQQQQQHPVDEFWAGRFLRYESDSVPTFSTKDLDGAWIPYGGGPRICPGRHFAKRQILLTTAMMVSLFDCDVLPEGRDMREDFSTKGFGGGISVPAGKVPVRLRRRVRD